MLLLINGIILGALNALYVSGNNVYRCISGANIGPSAPTHTSGIAPIFLSIGTTGTLGTPFLGAQSHTAGTQYFYGGNLYVCTTTGIASTALPPVHTSGVAASGAANFLYVGSPAIASVNWLASNQTVRSITLTSQGSGLSSAPTITFSVGVLGGTGSGATATAVYIQQSISPANSVFQKTGGTAITGGLTINSDQGTSVATAHPRHHPA